MGLLLAFYVGRGNLFDRVIRWATKSDVSHVEIVTSGPRYINGPGGPAVATVLGSSPRDGGVREVEIDWHPDHWLLVEVPWAPASAIARARAEIGAGYDWLGILLSQMLALRRGSRARWYCSELVMYCLDAPWGTFAPSEVLGLTLFANNIVSTAQHRAVSGR